jgi:hypothetical protein
MRDLRSKNADTTLWIKTVLQRLCSRVDVQTTVPGKSDARNPDRRAPKRKRSKAGAVKGKP